MNNYGYMEIMRLIPGKVQMIEKGIKDQTIQQFDQGLIIKLRHIYYGGIPGSLFLYMLPSGLISIGDKAQFMVAALEGTQFNMVHGVTQSIKNKKEGDQYTKPRNTTWFEVKEGNRTWIYDLFSLLKIERDLFYELEEPEIIDSYSEEVLINDPIYQEDKPDRFTLGDDFYLYMIIPKIEVTIETSPYRQYLRAELIRFKREINYEKRCEDALAEKRSRMW